MKACSKVKYATKAEAKTARRRLGLSGVRPYYCEEHQSWHLGNLGEEVMRGERSRREVYHGETS